MSKPCGSRERWIRKRLLGWYDRHRRDLPWRRRGGDPYAQWVAEVMLQQTRVETVVPYYQRFLTRFPTVAALAAADFDEVLKSWEGLGYYRRILHLHRAAGAVVEAGGIVPDTVEGLEALPGVGAYTARAVASIAFGRPAAAVDGNVARVISRLFGLDADPRTTGGKQTVQRIADQLLHQTRPGDFNQAWMDLGSMICTPRDPQCPQCPMENVCRAARSGDAARLPLRGTQRQVQKIVVAVGMFHDQGRLLVQRRPTGGLWSGLWEFPSVEVTSGGGIQSVVRTLASDVGVTLAGEPRKMAMVRHELTHRSIRFEAFLAEVAERNGRMRGRRWVDTQGFEKLAVSTAHRRVWQAVQGRVAQNASDNERSP
jgi:A/G-specific adenine glycosylase